MLKKEFSGSTKNYYDHVKSQLKKVGEHITEIANKYKHDETVYISSSDKEHLKTAIKSLNRYGANISSDIERIINDKPNYIDPKIADGLSRFKNIRKPAHGVYGVGVGAELCFGLAVSGQSYFVIDSKGNKGILVIGGAGGGFGGGAFAQILDLPNVRTIYDLEKEFTKDAVVNAGVAFLSASVDLSDNDVDSSVGVLVGQDMKDFFDNGRKHLNKPQMDVKAKTKMGKLGLGASVQTYNAKLVWDNKNGLDLF